MKAEPVATSSVFLYYICNMLKPENRLKKVRDFNLIIKNGRWERGRFIDLKYLELAKIKELFPKKEDTNEFANQLKIAFSVGVKLAKSSVKRNRIRRQMREVVRLLVKEGAIRGGCFLLFLAKKGSLEKNYAEISQEIDLILRKTRMTK